MPVFLTLGVWQLNRAAEKEQWLGQADTKAQPLQPNLSLLQQVRFQGDAIRAPVFLLDNRTYQGRVGYELLAPMRHETGLYLVSYGWIAAPPARTELPDWQIPAGKLLASGLVRPWPENALLDSQDNVPHAQNQQVWIVQALDASWLSEILGEPVNGLIQLDESALLGQPIWQPVSMTPAKHRGYALQWFAMAVALMGMFFYAGRVSHDPTDSESTVR